MASDCPVEALPSHLLAIILYRLPAADFIRSGAVCRLWRRAMADSPHRPSSPEIPYLMLPGFHPRFGKLFNLSTNKVSPLPIIGAQQCIGSSNGWVVTVDDLAELRTFNPFTGAMSQLPSTTTFSCIQGVRRNADTNRISGYICKNRFNDQTYFRNMKDMCNYFYKKAIFFPLSGMAIAIHDKFETLAFARVGDASWTELDSIIDDYFWVHDFVLHKGRLFAVNNRGCVVSFNLGGGSPYSPPTVTPDRSYPQLLESHSHYLVESLDGDLLQVCRETSFHVCRFRRGSRQKYLCEVRTKSFKVFKLELNGLRLEVTSLGVKTAMFLGRNHSMSVSTRDSPLKENCIYFTHCNVGNFMTNPHLRRDMGVFNLQDGSIEVIFPCNSALAGLCWSPPIWIVPALS